MIYNIDAEQYFLGCLMLEPGLVKETKIRPVHLSERHRIILDAILKADEKGNTPDIVAIVTEMGDDKVAAIGGVSYLTELIGAVPTTSNVKMYEQFIIDAYKLRLATEAAQRFIEDVRGSRDPILVNQLAQKMVEIQEYGSIVKRRSWRDILVDLVEESYQEKIGLTGINTGFAGLNRMTDGLQGNNLIIIGARPSMGKTAFALNIGTNACTLDDARVDIFSLETPEKRLAKRIIASVGNISAERLRRMDFDDKTRERFIQKVGLVDSFDLHIHDQSTITVEEIRSIVAESNRQARKEGKKHLVIIDYLQLITYRGPLQNKVQQIGHISRQLKLMAGDFDIPIIALSQLSRGVEQRQDKRPVMADLRESGDIEQDADIIAFLYRDDYYDKESDKKNITEVIIAKNRDGAVGTVELAFIKEYNKFLDLERRFDEAS
ncbi:replicative DNA helicase [Geobacillus phage TP-84]|uniref:DnaB-like replicative helicase n=1 Tax=Geobacillus phage TP-84 TaxID=1965361 RepID=UPI0009C29187|nr:DnaB-like replicative helicase [Geobacillus phage TP-84]UNW45399.1 replicative DNA helicase [Geobacillus phage TP-84]